MKSIYIVTGANGHLGNNIVKELIKMGESVRVLIVPGQENNALDNLDIEIVKANVYDIKSLDSLFKKEKDEELIVIHAAGIVSIRQKTKQIITDVNVCGTNNIIEMCKKHKVKRLVYVSSVHAIPEKKKGEIITEVSQFSPEIVDGMYAKTKAEATEAVLDAANSGLDAVVVHPSGIIGPNDYGTTHTTQLIIDYLNGRLSAGVIGGYDFVDVRDVASGVISAAQNGKKGNCYILSNKFICISDLLDMLHKISKKKKIKVFIPLWFAKLTAPLSEIYYKIRKTKPLYTRYSLDTLQSNAVFSHEKADKELSYKVRDFYETLSDTVTFLIRNNKV